MQSLYVHVSNIPQRGAQITYVIVDSTTNQRYIANRSLTYQDTDIEIPLPDSFQVGHLVRLSTFETFPYSISLLGDSSKGTILGEPGIDFWMPASPQPGWKDGSPEAPGHYALMIRYR